MMNTTGLKLTCALVGLSLTAGASSSLQEAQDAQDAPRVWLTSDLIGMKVVSPQGDGLGKIEDVVVHPGGDSAYAVLSFGGWLGMGDKLFAMPWSVLRTVERDSAEQGSERSLVLPVSKDKLKQAPGFDKKNWPTMANAPADRCGRAHVDHHLEGQRSARLRRRDAGRRGAGRHQGAGHRHQRPRQLRRHGARGQGGQGRPSDRGALGLVLVLPGRGRG
jgi:hypothetical protein